MARLRQSVGQSDDQRANERPSISTKPNIVVIAQAPRAGDGPMHDNLRYSAAHGYRNADSMSKMRNRLRPW